MEKSKLVKAIFIQLSGILLLFACGFGNTNNSLSEEDQIGTMVAATLLSFDSEGIEELPAPIEIPATDSPPTEIPPTPVPPTTRVTYIDNNNVWLWDITTGNIQLSTGLFATRVLISDDGERIVFTTKDAFGLFDSLYKINADGSDLLLLFTLADIVHLVSSPDSTGINPYSMVFIPGSHEVAFNTQLSFDGPGLFIQNDHNIVDADTGVLTFLLPAGLGGEFSYSPNGSQFAIIWPDAIHLINADGSNRRNNILQFDSVITYSEYSYYPHVRWAIDGSALMAAIPSADSLAPNATIAFSTIPLDGSPGVSLYTPIAVSPLFFSESQISPDLSKVLFSEKVGDHNELSHALMGGAGKVPYNSGYINLMGWANNSTHFSFKLDGYAYVGANGMPPFAISGDKVSRFEWLIDTTYVYTSGSIDAWTIYLGNIAGTPPIMVASPVGSFINFDAVRTP